MSRVRAATIVFRPFCKLASGVSTDEPVTLASILRGFEVTTIKSGAGLGHSLQPEGRSHVLQVKVQPPAGSARKELFLKLQDTEQYGLA